MAKTEFEIKQELKAEHEERVKKYVGKKTDKGVIEKIHYLTFDGACGGNYDDLPQIGRRGLVQAVIGTKSYTIGELQIIE